MRVTLSLIIISVAVFPLQLMVAGVTRFFALTPALALTEAPWQFVTYMFLHGDPLHLMINMFVLAIFGVIVERHMGWRNYLSLYLVAGVGSAFFHMLLTGHSDILMLGASGSIFGILTAYGFLFPRTWIIMFPGIPMPAILAVVVFAALEIFFGVFGLEPGIANWGHLGGIVAGVLFMVIWKLYKRRMKGGTGFGDFEWVWE
jgi:membrane associated rhomboid family serine protease